MSMYADVAAAKSAGALGSDPEILAAITEASERVERYTGDLFTPTTLTLERIVGTDGVVLIGKTVQSITSVRWVGAPQVLASTSYRLSTTKRTLSMYGDLSWADVTVLGAEPWNGGWAGLSRSGADLSVEIVGSFGWSSPPPAVARATALIAAKIRASDRTTDEGGPSDLLADGEGNVLPVLPHTHPGRDDDAPRPQPIRGRTTGVLEADELLASYVREPVRMRA